MVGTIALKTIDATMETEALLGPMTTVVTVMKGAGREVVSTRRMIMMGDIAVEIAIDIKHLFKRIRTTDLAIRVIGRQAVLTTLLKCVVSNI